MLSMINIYSEYNTASRDDISKYGMVHIYVVNPLARISWLNFANHVLGIYLSPYIVWWRWYILVSSP